MRRSTLTALALASVLCVTPLVSACAGGGGGETSAVSNEDTTAVEQKQEQEPEQEPSRKAAENDSIKIDEIDWTVDESVIDGSRDVAFSYTNNSPYSIFDLKLEFTQRADVTEEDRAVFDGVYENKYWDTEPEDLYVVGYGRQYTEPGESTDPYWLSLCGTYTEVDSMEQYSLMEPSLMTIDYVGDDGKVYEEYYDFKTDKYSQSRKGGRSAVSWSDSELASMVPTVSSPVVTVDYDSEGMFSFKAADMSLDDYDSYVTQCKEKGFTDDSYESSGYYRASNEDGYEVTVSFSEYENVLSAYVTD